MVNTTIRGEEDGEVFRENPVKFVFSSQSPPYPPRPLSREVLGMPFEIVGEQLDGVGRLCERYHGAMELVKCRRILLGDVTDNHCGFSARVAVLAVSRKPAASGSTC